MMKNTIFLLLFVFALFACEDDNSAVSYTHLTLPTMEAV